MIDLLNNATINNVHFAYEPESGQFTFVSAYLLEAFGQTAGNFSLALISQQVYPEDLIKIKEAYERLLNNQFSGSITFKLGTEEELRWYSVTPFLAKTKDPAPIVFGSFHEITDEIDNLNAIARYANKKNSILHMLAHDLRGPLNIARSLVTSLDREIADEGILERTRYVSAIIQQSIDLITDLLSREFLDTVEVSLFKKNTDVVQMLTEYMEECRLSSHTAARNFSLQATQQQIFVDIDEPKFMQIMNNLVSNSLKFTRPGGNIIVMLEDHGEVFRMVFKDDGIGIPEHLLPEIFEKFTSAGRPGLAGEPTIGLGLSIVKIIVAWHHGRIWCESKEGEGTLFFIEMPKVSVDP